MTTHQKVRTAIDRMLDEGVHPTTIRVILTPLVKEYDDVSPGLLTTLIEERHQGWLAGAEHQMAAYAAQESWTRLSQLLATYRKVVTR